MNYRVFQYPLPAPPELEDLNAWLASQRVVGVQHHVVPQPGGAMLVFVVQSVSGTSAFASGSGDASRPRVDYKKVLDPETFARFSVLRDSRKVLGNELGVPVYTLFTNEQLAAMAACHPATLAGWQAVEGVGTERIEKYGPRLLASLHPESESKAP